jgi:hypothetical protein
MRLTCFILRTTIAIPFRILYPICCTVVAMSMSSALATPPQKTKPNVSLYSTHPRAFAHPSGMPRSASSLSESSTSAALSEAYAPASLAPLVASVLGAANGHPSSTAAANDARSHAVRRLRELAVDAEGPGAPFTKTPRGLQLLQLISVVVRNVGLNDKVGALKALQLLKANDEALRALSSAGVIPALLKALDDENVGDETRADAARTLSAMASSVDVCKMMIRGGALERLGASASRNAAAVVGKADGRASDEARYAAEALTRMSGRSAIYDSRALFPISSEPTESDLVSESVVKSLVEVLTSEMRVAHVDAALALGRMASSGPEGRRAVARCGAVLPLVTAALGGERQRNASLATLHVIADAANSNVASMIINQAEENPGVSYDREELTMEEKKILERVNLAGTASSMGGLNFFHEMIDVLGALLRCRHSLEPAAADAALALWALAWQPSNRSHMVTRVTEGLTVLAREGCVTARDDALSVLSVLALDDGGREAIYAQTDGGRLLDYLMMSTAEGISPRAGSPHSAFGGMGFNDVFERERSGLGTRASSSTSLSFAVSRMHCS